MRLAHPLWLLALVPVFMAALAGWLFTESRRAAWTYPGSSLLKNLMPARNLWVRLAPQALKVLALLLGVLALARPQQVKREAALNQGIDILLVLDTSTSMRALDFDPLDRMGAAKNAAIKFISGRVSDRIGILVFGGDPLLTCPLTLDYDALLEFLGGVSPGMTHSEGTAIGDGIAAAVNHLKSSTAKSKVIILLTDGRSNTGIVDPLTAANVANTYGIKIYAIGAGSRGPALYPVDDPLFGRRLVQMPDDLDEDTLLKVAALSDGKYFRATNLEQLTAVYREIDRMEKTEIRQSPIISYTDFYPYLLWPAVLCLAGEMLLSATVLLRLP